jgi:hypothetical protein
MDEVQLLLIRVLWILEIELGDGYFSDDQATAIEAVHEQIQRAQQLLRGDQVPSPMSDRTNALLSSMEARIAIDNARGL